jgi:N-methylhydantoinase A
LSKPADWTVGVDIGGTFTDIVLAGPEGALFVHKTLSTPDDYGRGIAAGVRAVLEGQGVAASAVRRVVHATTVATNTVLEKKGAKAALITTQGFRDVLEMRRLRIPEMYTLKYQRPEPLVPRRLRLEVAERLGPRGEVRVPLDEATVTTAAERIKAAGVGAVAISLIHAYANSDHEHRVAEILRTTLDSNVYITCSSDILPVIREYERTSTTVINAYLGPALRHYFDSVMGHLRAIGVDAPIQIMKSDGGVMTLEAASDRPSYIVESGPAAGVIGAARTAAEVNSITLDMGGTTAKASIVEGGEVARTADYEVGAGINLSSKLIMGGGYALKLPVIDISEIGAGGGSLVSIDAGGLVHVGPESAGAHPGPVAYGQGGEQVTFTDAVLNLGYLNPDHLVGGGLKLETAAARAALMEQVAKPLNKEALDAAWGVFQVACGTMVRAVKAVSTYRGRDPRDFALFAFGGNGPVVATAIAELLEMTHVIVPPNPGVYSAYGLLLSGIEHEVTRGHLARLAETTPADLGARFRELEEELAQLMADEGYGVGAFDAEWRADTRYAGEAHEVTVPVPRTADGAPDFDRLQKAFGNEHERTYGHQAEAEEVECVTLRVNGRVSAEFTPDKIAVADGAPPGSRAAYFGPSGQVDASVVSRAALVEHAAGPLIVEEYDATCVVPPGWQASLDDAGNIHLRVM